VISAIGTDAGPSFGGDFTPFATQGGGVDKVVDDAVITEFTYKGVTIDLDLTTPVPAGGDDGADISWTYIHDTDLDGNDIFKAVVTDASDGSVLIFGNNGYYNYTPDQSGLSTTEESVTLTSGANVTSSDITLTGFNDTGASANLIYSSNGVTVEGGANNDRIDLGESVIIDFTAKGGNPNGVQNIEFDLTSASSSETVTYTIYGLDGTTVLGTENSALDPFTISSADYMQIGKIEFTADSSTYVRILGITYDQIDAPFSTNAEPILVEYILTDTDGQSDTAQLAVYTPDQTIVGTTGIDNISGGDLNDKITGDEGDDILSGNDGHDTISGGLGDDTIDGGTGQDYISGNEGDDSISGGADSDHIDGDAGNDLLDGGTGDDVVQGGDGDDLLFGGAGDDRLEGEDGNDVLDGNVGSDILLGGEGTDTLVFDSADIMIDGGNDIDMLIIKETGVLDFSNVENIETIDISGNGIQSLEGISLDDILSMTDENNTITITGDAVDDVTAVDKSGWSSTSSTANGDGTTTFIYSNDTTADSVSVTIDDNVNNTGL
ncbi:MAG: hypothetical protein J7M03_04815, partial [Candidatus Desulfofervidaceae bacterium]|nr:hypothetical protein [Candidatus Desulfofervidaceae bacterium]